MHIAVLPRSNLFAVGRSLLAAWLLARLMGASSAAPMENSEIAGKAAGSHLARLHQDAEQGSPLAQYLLGAFYQLGEAIPQDYAEAANWYGRAADQGLAVAQFALGAMYARGEGVPEDVVRAAHLAQLIGNRRRSDPGSAEADTRGSRTAR